MDPNPRLLAEPENWELATCLACDLRLATHLGRAAYGRCGPAPLPSDGARRRGRTWFVFGRGTKAGSRTMSWESLSPSTHSSPHSSPLSLWRPLYSSARRSAGASTKSATQPSLPRGSQEDPVSVARPLAEPGPERPATQWQEREKQQLHFCRDDRSPIGARSWEPV